ncbi:unnamed protein product [Rotaria sordida]|uniref:N-acetyltransferase domain-containing protein n=1 Tax=Rotaria sordida TaxID=392033 RepID=A0A818LHS3_9BILA|nr:unnamed protein product [Rotaria sordida]CAF1486312.1 unnamed protein product [Rotaria sordida]CAF1649991.1 unnamed protein product [Rotaria sordida]CAF3572385.1 unnamed protein product [Rotaria sordida]CAF3702322.1 unnamed protein product [Rotaria sordida]
MIRNDKIELINLLIRPVISTDIYYIKLLLSDCSIFQRGSIDYSMYFFSFRPNIFYIITSKQDILGHASIKQWNINNHNIISVFMLGLVYVRYDYRKFGFGELLTNYVFNIKSEEINDIHANILTEHLPFYIRYGFQISFSLIGFVGKLSEFYNRKLIVDEDINIELYELSDILDIATYDHKIYPTYRIEYFEQLREHIYSIAGYVARSKKTNSILGYVILNFSQQFIKCGPLYADNINIALLLLKQCASDYDGFMLISLPYFNKQAIQIFKSKHFKQTDIIHRVYKGNQIFLNQFIFQQVFAITDDWFSLI